MNTGSYYRYGDEQIDEASDEKADEIAYDLLGTCQSEPPELENANDYIRDLVFAQVDLCSVCGWWCETSDLDGSTGELVCSECADNKDED